MVARILRAAMTASVLGVPCSAAAQTTVTLDVPLNLTQVSPDIEKVRIFCGFSPSGDGLVFPTNLTNEASVIAAGFAQQLEMPVMAGQVVVTMRLMFPISADMLPAAPVGKKVDYGCGLIGFSKSLQKWDQFSETQTVAAFRLKPTPQTIMGSFVW
jgi:hypothetical protein